MPQSLTATHIIRLNNLLRLLREKEYIKPDELMKSAKYSSRSPLENDLKLLRRTFHAKIFYSRKVHAYHLEDCGDFLLLLKPEAITEKQ